MGFDLNDAIKLIQNSGNRSILDKALSQTNWN